MPIDQHDMSAKYDGRVIKVEIYVNTDEEHYALLKRIRRAARGDRLNATLMALSVYEGEEGKKVWDVIQKLIKDNPGTKEIF